MASNETFPCPACGKDVRAGAVSCRACGADAKTGWGEAGSDAWAQETSQELDLPASHLDDEGYAEFVREELESEDTRPSPPSAWSFFLIVCLVLAIAAALALLTVGGKKP